MEIFRNTYFEEYLRTTASKSSDLEEFSEKSALKTYVKMTKGHTCQGFLKVRE